MSELELHAIEARAKAHHYGHQGQWQQVLEQDVPALVAEVRRLRDERDAYRTSVAGLHAALAFKQGAIEDMAATIERLGAENCGCVSP